MKNEKIPMVSIITPVFNMESYIGQAIESILAQDYNNIEYIVINDGSTDETYKILEKYCSKLKIINQVNMGVVSTLNKGWDMSKGKYLSYLSADDIISPSTISSMVTILENNSSVACAYPNSDLIDKYSNILKKNVCKNTYLEDLVIKQECYIGPGAVFRAEHFKKIGGWNKSFTLAPDRDFWIKLFEYGTFVMHHESLAQYRMHKESYSVKELSESKSREYINFLDNYFTNPDIPLCIERRKKEAYGFATLIISRNRLKDYDFVRGIRLYREACKIYPELKRIKYKSQLIRSIISRPARVVQSFLFKLKKFIF